MKILSAGLVCLVVLTSAAPAMADSFIFERSWGGDRHDRFGRHDRHDRRWDRDHRHRHRHGSRVTVIERHYWGGPRYYEPPQVVYVTPPPPPVIYQQPQIIYTNPSPLYDAVPASDDYRDREGRLCREFQSTARVGGNMVPTYGTACLMPDGDWKVVR